MNEVIEKKSGIKFAYDRMPEMTTIIATANDYELPKVFTRIKSSAFDMWEIEMSLTSSCGYLFHGYCYRGRSFAEKLAREAIRGCFSRLGKRRRLTANRQKKAEVK